MSAKSDGEVDRIVAREKPGYRRVERPRRAAAAGTRAPDAVTRDLPALQAAVEALGLWDIQPGGAKRRAPAAIDEPVRSPAHASGHGDTHRRASVTHHIVTVGHARQHESDPLQTRVVVVSRSQQRIIGEQG
jgi:hypothetical protein